MNADTAYTVKHIQKGLTLFTTFTHGQRDMPHMNKMKKPKVVAFITDSYMSYLTNEFLSGISQFVRKRRNYIIRLFQAESLDECGDMLSGCDGIIINSSNERIVSMAVATGRPLVDTGCEFDCPCAVCVDIDLARTGSMAAEWFLQRGFRNFAFYGMQGLRSSDVVESAFSSAVAKAGFECACFSGYRRFAERNSRTNVRKIITRTRKWLASLPRRTAMLCKTDLMANRVLLECMQAGRTVPDDIAIMGRHNDVNFCTSVPVTISSVDTNIRRQGYVAMRILAELVEHPVTRKARKTFLVRPGEIVERESTATWPVDPPYLAKALMLLDGSLGSRTSIASLAAAVGVPPTTLRSTFSKVLGTSIGKYELSLRLNEARRLIKNGLAGLKEVATMTGFRNQSHFCHAYRAFHGHPPGGDR